MSQQALRMLLDSKKRYFGGLLQPASDEGSVDRAHTRSLVRAFVVGTRRMLT